MARILMIGVIVTLTADAAVAQFPELTRPALPTLPKVRTGTAQQPVKPTFSPWLNLLRKDGGMGFQYYRGVLPEREFRDAQQEQARSLRSLGREIEEIKRPPAAVLGGGLGTTGHPTTFQSYGGSAGSRSPSGNRPVSRRSSARGHR